MGAGADDFIPKPFRESELKVRLNAGLRIIALHNELAAKIAQLAEATEQMRRDLEAAAAMQISLLPPKNGTIPGINYSWQYIPCERLSGDLFNVIKLDETHVGIYILDVSGHGVPAALHSVALSRFITAHEAKGSLLVHRTQSGEHRITSPAEVTRRLNSDFQFPTSRGDFITFLYGVLNHEERTFTYTRAGHPTPLIISQGKHIDVSHAGDPPLGILAGAQFEEYTLQLNPGDRIYFFTDGISEAENPNEERFGEHRLIDRLVEYASDTLDSSINKIIDEVISWIGDRPRRDDLTILGVEIT